MFRMLARAACAALISLTSAFTYSQSLMEEIRAEMLSAWLVTVEGEARTRTLRISGVEQAESGRLILEAVYGMTDGNQTAVRAEILQTDRIRTLFIVTQPGSKLSASQTSNGVFIGTFAATNGQTKGLKIEKITDAEFVKLRERTTASSGPKITPPGSDVPKECVAWIGGWSGEWQAIGFRNQGQLWVRSVDKDCNASIASSGPMDWKTHNVKNGRISDVFCNRNTGGMCRFEISSDLSTLNANYTNTAGGRNWGSFTRISPK